MGEIVSSPALDRVSGYANWGGTAGALESPRPYIGDEGFSMQPEPVADDYPRSIADGN